MKNISIYILGFIVVISAGYIFKLRQQISVDRVLLAKSVKTIDSLTSKLQDEMSKQKYIEAIADRNLAKASIELEEARKKKK